MGKNAVLRDQWPVGFLYPTFCSGPAYALGTQACQKILSAAELNSKITDEFPLEDVLFTGLLREAAGINEDNVKIIDDIALHFQRDKQTKLTQRLLLALRRLKS